MGLGVCNPDLIYPAACRLALSEVNAPAIVIDESCRIFPRAPGKQEADVAWINTWKQRKPSPPPRGKADRRNRRMVGREARAKRTWNSSQVPPPCRIKIWRVLKVDSLTYIKKVSNFWCIKIKYRMLICRDRLGMCR